MKKEHSTIIKRWYNWENKCLVCFPFLARKSDSVSCNWGWKELNQRYGGKKNKFFVAARTRAAEFVLNELQLFDTLLGNPTRRPLNNQVTSHTINVYVFFVWLSSLQPGGQMCWNATGKCWLMNVSHQVNGAFPETLNPNIGSGVQLIYSDDAHVLV